MGDSPRPAGAVPPGTVTSPFTTVARVLRTVGHLRARQVLRLALHRLRPAPRPVAPDTVWSPASADRTCAALTALGPVSGAEEAESRANAWLAGRLTVLGLDVPWTGDWRMGGPSPLWRYHLHYHEHLADLAWLAARDGDARAAARLVSDLEGWIAAWGSGGTPAWDAYPVSVRIVSWLRILGWAGPMLPEALRTTLERGIATHTAHLAHALEWHLDGNHLLRNAVAVVLGSSCLGGDRSDAARAQAARLFRTLMAEQVHEDGWHFERSPMYHARVLRDAMEVEACALAHGRPLDPRTRTAIDRMADALRWMRRADGSLWLLNDSAQDHGVDLAVPLARAPEASPVRGVRHFRNAAVVVVAGDGGDHLRIDLGAPAPAHQPAHAHAGALALEVDVAGVPCVVDSGCSGYDGDPWRPYLRGTSAHNTVVLDGQDQSEMWATFRVGGRAEVSEVSCTGDAEDCTVRGECRSFRMRASVHRRVVRREGRRITVTDEIAGARPGSIEGFWHFAPDWEARLVDERTVVLESGALSVRLRTEGTVQASLHRGERSPTLGWQAARFNRAVPAWTLRLRVAGPQAPTWSVTIDPD